MLDLPELTASDVTRFGVSADAMQWARAGLTKRRLDNSTLPQDDPTSSLNSKLPNIDPDSNPEIVAHHFVDTSNEFDIRSTGDPDSDCDEVAGACGGVGAPEGPCKELLAPSCVVTPGHDGGGASSEGPCRKVAPP